VAHAAAAADLVADAKKDDDEDDPEMVIGTDFHSLEIRDMKMGESYLLVWESDESSSSSTSSQ
jgi:hypothetical protein